MGNVLTADLADLAIAIGILGDAFDHLKDATRLSGYGQLPSLELGESQEAQGIVTFWNEALASRMTDIGRCIRQTEAIQEWLRSCILHYDQADTDSADAIRRLYQEFQHDALEGKVNPAQLPPGETGTSGTDDGPPGEIGPGESGAEPEGE